MRRTRRIAFSTAVTTGVLGVAGVAAAAIPAALASSAPSSTQADPTAQQKRALQAELAALNARTGTLGHDLTSAQAQLLAARRA
ncbi:MAG: hypothetical protein ACHQE5_10240, partial [Actinomycetes bacterium]